MFLEDVTRSKHNEFQMRQSCFDEKRESPLLNLICIDIMFLNQPVVPLAPHLLQFVILTVLFFLVKRLRLIRPVSNL